MHESNNLVSRSSRSVGTGRREPFELNEVATSDPAFSQVSLNSFLLKW